jgi:Pyruvate/2-oxoacid:ferredoxin oxidoreductase gamma subunit
MTDAEKSAMTKKLIALGALFAIYKFVPNSAVKAMALGVGGVVVAKSLPVLKEAV